MQFFVMLLVEGSLFMRLMLLLGEVRSGTALRLILVLMLLLIGLILLEIGSANFRDIFLLIA